jgi:eukaryotic-like serine/threonine-protein kinase
MAEILETLQLRLDGKYRVERELGRGGMATVYYAHDLVHDREVAIKVLNPDLSATIGAERFNREITLASRLNHPHILGFYESGQTDGLLYYVMPFVRGESLRDKIDREGQLGIGDAVRIIREVASALGHAHTQHVVHRDVKPENILLLENGHALVADFGIARAATEGDAQKLTQTGMAIGTPVYMSPEQSTGEKVGPAADIYSLGCVLYEMLSGEPPFTGKNAMAIMARHAMETVPAIRIVRSSVPEEVEEAIFAAMEKSPVDRPKTCDEFLEIVGTPMHETAMRRVTRMTTTRRIPTPVPLPPTPWYKKPGLVAAALAVVAIGGFGAWKFTTGAAPAQLGAEARSIAVLYFDNETKDSSLGFLADGITEAVIASLSGIEQINVVSRSGSEQFRGSNAPADSIAQALDVGILVKGNLEKDGERIRVNVRLVDRSNAELGRGRVGPFDATSLALRDSVAAQVAELIRERLGTQIKLRDQRDATRNEQAWLAVQRAEAARKRYEAAYVGGDTATASKTLRQIDSLLVSAASLDAKWATPLNLRATVAYFIARRNPDFAVKQQAVDSGLTWANASLTRSPLNADGLEMRGNLTYFRAISGLETSEQKVSVGIDAARQDLEQATKVNPAQAGAWSTLSHLYTRIPGASTEVINAADKALSADAFLSNAAAVYDRVFSTAYDQEVFDLKAAPYCDKISQRFKGSFNALRCQLMMMTIPKPRSSDVKRAWALADSTVTAAPQAQQAMQRFVMQMYVAAVLVRAGLTDSARAVADRARSDGQTDPKREAMLRGGFVYALLGDTVASARALKEYLAANPDRRQSFEGDAGWWFRPVQASPTFKRIVGTE